MFKELRKIDYIFIVMGILSIALIASLFPLLKQSAMALPDPGKSENGLSVLGYNDTITETYAQVDPVETSHIRVSVPTAMYFKANKVLNNPEWYLNMGSSESTAKDVPYIQNYSADDDNKAIQLDCTGFTSSKPGYDLVNYYYSERMRIEEGDRNYSVFTNFGLSYPCANEIEYSVAKVVDSKSTAGGTDGCYGIYYLMMQGSINKTGERSLSEEYSFSNVADLRHWTSSIRPMHDFNEDISIQDWDADNFKMTGSQWNDTSGSDVVNSRINLVFSGKVKGLTSSTSMNTLSEWTKGVHLLNTDWHFSAVTS